MKNKETEFYFYLLDHLNEVKKDKHRSIFELELAREKSLTDAYTIQAITKAQDSILLLANNISIQSAEINVLEIILNDYQSKFENEIIKHN